MKAKQRVYIKGSAERGNEVIKFLENLGGYNCYSLDGHNSNNYYFITPDGTIQSTTYPASSIFSFVKEFYKEIDLPRWKPKYDENYYYFTDIEGIMVGKWKNNPTDSRRYDFGNCFKSYEEAKEARDKIEELLKHT